MKKLTLALLICSLGLAAHAQRLIYEWNFTNTVTGTPTNMPAAYVGINQSGQSLTGSGNLNIINLKGLGAGTNSYFTNGVGVGPGIVGVPNPLHPEYGSSSSLGAYVVQGGGYNGSSPSAEAQGTNLNLGTMYRYAVTFWFQLGPSMGNRFPRILMVGNVTNYDEATSGVFGNAASLNGWSTAVTPNVAKSMQNDLSGTGQANGSSPSLGPQFTNSTGVNGIICDSSTWYFCAEQYNGSTNSAQWTSWLGTSTTNVVRIDAQNLAFLGIPFGTNACIQIGGNVTGNRCISDGQIADVRFYAGNISSNNLEALRTLDMTKWSPDSSGDPLAAPVINLQPQSGATFAGGTRRFSLDADGLSPLTFQWKSNSVPITGATNIVLVLTNIQPSANNALITCTVTNGIAATNSAAAVLSVFAAAPGSYDYAVLTNQPYIYWHANENTNLDGSPVNISDYANGFDGTAAFPANNTFQVPGLNAPAYPGFTTTNVGTEVHTGNNPTDLNMASLANWTNGMTICGWINTFSVPASHAIIYSMLNNNLGSATTASGYGLMFSGIGTDVNGNTGGQLSYNWNANGIGSSPAGSSTPFQSGLIVPTNEWTFVALTIAPDGASATLYKGSPGTGIQTSLDDTNATTDIIAGATGFAPKIVLGRSPYGFWDGTGFGANNIAFSDMAVFYSALPASTITNLYVIGAGVPHPRLTAVSDINNPGYIFVNWNFGTLQESTDVSGPYTDVAGPLTTPYYIPATDPQHFFRARN